MSPKSGADSKLAVSTGFTLVELLVVAAIMAILAAIMLPVYAAVRQRVGQSVCLDNLHQLGAAISLYESDDDSYLPYASDCMEKALSEHGMLPGSDAWQSLIWNSGDIRYVLTAYDSSGENFRCPSDVYPIPGQLHGTSWFNISGCSYAYIENYALVPSSIARFKTPSTSYLMSDYDCYFHGGDRLRNVCGMTNTLLLDFHVSALTLPQVTAAMKNDAL